ncbi:uncharacterized protein EI90DRAFT_3064100 [Cantharellus anzutake]|uniref:uncharacterized protein n=1 Tax=Cantharellus anzutake TaxID=1750568 RepID=UPI0019045391|nr:uncharacterized protein EI90DRAFT_3071501 [Cantharellus anzutake]XP_038914617.1 uncharacterized protein EI90DRAFT_3064100 [Cantharellus anzutake]KAF8326103.1 hypothetical protein EI90DRAFT_3071501 [Cantharellus anzutake]KAF8328933.1 hypothetical protein EI90DRAFT_3064100 [Cantharellus anzutake]
MAGVTAEGRIKASTLSTVQRRDPTEGSRPASNDGSGSHSYITTAVGGFTDSIMKAMTKAKPNNALMMEKDPMRRQGNEMAPIEQDTTNGIKENFSPQRLWQNGTIKIMDVGRFSAKAIAVLPRSPGGSSLSRSNDTSSSQSHTSTNNSEFRNRQRRK